MYKGKTILALITARGGSKGIPLKNIAPLGGRPLIQWTIDAAKESKYVDRTILSSDSDMIIKLAKSLGCEVPFVRPSHLASDDTSSMDVIMHALGTLERKYDYLLLLQPTSPFRTALHIDDAIERIVDTQVKMLVSVRQLKSHPMFMYQIVGGFLQAFIETDKQLRRQDIPKTYGHNGAIYLSETDYLLSKRSYCGDGVTPFEMDGISSIDIDDEFDLQYAEFILSMKKPN